MYWIEKGGSSDGFVNGAIYNVETVWDSVGYPGVLPVNALTVCILLSKV